MRTVHYWNQMTSTRLSRRKTLAISATGAAAAFLAACGGGGSTKVEDVNTLVTKPADTSKQAKKGGTLNHYRGSGTDNMDPYASLSNITSSITGMAYSRLTMLEAGYNQESGGNIVGDVAESWEWSPDRL